jgi:hypothetical protein
MSDQEILLGDPAAPDVHWEQFAVLRENDTVAALVSLINGRGYIGGSFAAYVLSGSPILVPNDIDIFATTAENATLIANDIYHRYPSAAYGNSSEVAITVSRWSDERSFQVIRPNPLWKEFPNDILKSFDMDICRAIILTEKCGMADTNIGRPSAKILRTQNALRTLRRVMKYHKRGVKFSDHELLKLFQAWGLTSNEKKAEMLETARKAIAEPAYEADSEDWDYDEDDDWFEGE